MQYYKQLIYRLLTDKQRLIVTGGESQADHILTVKFYKYR